VVRLAAQTVCRTRAEAARLEAAFPPASPRIRVVPSGVDARAIRAARPYERPGRLVLAVGRLEQGKNLERTIAAMASLGEDHRMVVVGDGPSRSRLRAHAADLRVASRVRFAGAVADAELYRWLRTAEVVVNLGEERTSGAQLLEGITAGAPVVASDIAAHREMAARSDPAGVVFVSPEGSPLEVADAILEAEGLCERLREQPCPEPPSWDAVADGTLELYETLRGTVRVPARVPVGA
jgi:glycosyltransferase involved in cell wall biosynthesis